MRILRRGYNYTDGINELGQLDAGLLFLAFMKDPAQFIRLQTRLGSSDKLNEYISHIGSGIFAVPPAPARATTSPSSCSPEPSVVRVYGGGAPGQSRTGDLSLRRRLLYPLSYWGGTCGLACGKPARFAFLRFPSGWERWEV